MKNLLRAIFAALLFQEALTAGITEPAGDIPLSKEYVLRTWEVTDGLSDNHIAGITRSTDGYLWVTNFSGLFRFDGNSFVRMNDQTLPGLPSPWVRLVFEARDRALWLGLERGGIARWRQNKLDTIVPIKPRPTSTVWPYSFAEDSSGAIWFGETKEAQVSHVTGGKVSVYSAADGVPVGTNVLVRATSRGEIWCATSGGCARFDGLRFQPVDPEAGGAPVRLMIASSSIGGMWAIRGGKLLRYDDLGNRLESIEPKWLQEAGQINVLHEDRTGTLWIGTQAIGLLCLRAGEFRRVATSFADISCMSEDQEGNLWVGTWGGGLNRLSPRRFFVRQTRSDSMSEAVQSVCEDAQGQLWTVDRNGLTMHMLKPAVHNFSSPLNFPKDLSVTAICADLESGVWLGTPDGLMRCEDGNIEHTPFLEPINGLFMDREGLLWIITGAGDLFLYSNVRPKQQSGVTNVCALAEDHQGCLWVGTRPGSVFRQNNGHLEKVELPGAGDAQDVRFIVPDVEDTVWIGTLLGGLFRWKDGKVLKVQETAGVSLAEVRSLLIEPVEAAKPSAGKSSPKDNFWIGTATGLLRISREALNGFLDGRRASLPLVACGSNEGLPNVEFTEGAQNTAVRTKDGHLWFATNRGVLEIFPGAMPNPTASAGVIIEEASSNALTLRPGGPNRWAFPPQPGSIRIRYTMPELRSPEQVRFRYRLGDTEDGQWVEAGNSREMTILRPEPRNYHVEISATVGDAPWISPPRSIDLIVRPAWWQTATFRWGATCVLLAALVVLVRAVVMQQMRAQLRRIEQERAVERERSRIARDMHDELGANLTYIAAATHLAGIEAPEVAAEHLREISFAVRETVDSLDEIVWAVNPNNDTLEGLTEYLGKFTARFLAATSIEAEITFPDAPPPLQVSAEQRHHLFLSVKEALNNVVKHSGATKARVSIQIIQDLLKIDVCDNGRGFDPEVADGFSNGLSNMRGRMAKLGGGTRISSVSGAGSSVTLNFPLLG